MLNQSDIKGVETASPQSRDKIMNKLGVVTVYSDEVDEFCQEFVKTVAQHRHWDRQALKDMVPA